MLANGHPWIIHWAFMLYFIVLVVKICWDKWYWWFNSRGIQCFATVRICKCKKLHLRKFLRIFFVVISWWLTYEFYCFKRMAHSKLQRLQWRGCLIKLKLYCTNKFIIWVFNYSTHYKHRVYLCQQNICNTYSVLPEHKQLPRAQISPRSENFAAACFYRCF